MTPTELAGVIKAMGGFWPSAEQSIVARSRWLNDHGVAYSDAIAILDDMATVYDRLPSVKDMSVKLAERGADTRAPVGQGSRVVVERMKSRIMDYAHDSAQRQQISVNERLRLEQSSAKDALEDAVACGLGSDAVGYWSDMGIAYAELVTA